MKDFDPWAVGGPSLLVAPADYCPVLTDALPPSGSIIVARLDGAKLVEAYDVFEKFSTKLNFPAYFGWNWDALSDCLRDLSWCPADRYMIIVDNAESALVATPEEREILLHILSRAAQAWANPLGKPGGEGIPFKVLLLCADESVEALRLEVGTKWS